MDDIPAQDVTNLALYQTCRDPGTMYYLLSYYLANKRSLHIRSQGLEILTLIGEK